VSKRAVSGKLIELMSDTPPTTSASAQLTTADVLLRIWNQLTTAAADRHHAMHTAVVANVDSRGRPVARVVVFRKVDVTLRELYFHTDNRSIKVVDLQRDPHLAWTFYDPASRVQIRAEGIATVHTTDEIGNRQWEASQRMSRICYTQALGPSQAIEGPAQLPPALADGRANFSAIRTVVTRLEWLWLDSEGHQRMLLDFDGNEWKGTWLAP
jgi:pyridoxamine 5'-phosphate oxidase